MALLSALGIRSDPVLGHNFLISLIDTSSTLALAKSIVTSAITDVALGGFTECTGLEMSLEIKDYEEGGNNGAVLKFPTRVKWSNITLKKGIGFSTALWDWHYGFVEGSGKRRDGLIMLMDDLGVPHNIWYFKRGLPLKYTAPSMNASQNNVAIEAIEIAHEGIYQVPGVSLGAAAVSGAVSVGFAIT
ncbi:MAG TPA: phage tail protein [Chloroflexia bacterium]|nr:phage tail protein [Chloroflexia bacterium]